MARREVLTRVCDRCVEPTPATHSEQVCFGGSAYRLDLCGKHRDMLEADLQSWLRLGTETQAPHAASGTWVPGQRFREKRPAGWRDGVRRSAGPRSLDLPPADGGTVVVEPDVVPFERPDKTLKSTASVRGDMALLGLTWLQVTDAVDAAFAQVPSAQPGVCSYVSETLSVLVADDGAVLGVARRSPKAPLPHGTDVDQRRLRADGRPLELTSIMAAVAAKPGWGATDTGSTYVVRGPGDKHLLVDKSVATKAPQGVLQDLRDIGLDLGASALQAG